MEWNIGQKVVCDRPEQLLTGCTIKAKEEGSVIISCPNIDLVFWGQQEQLEQLGWRPDNLASPPEPGLSQD